MLVAKNLMKDYDGLEVLKGIDLSIQKGEYVSIIGASGAGKSTLLQILGTLDAPSSGDFSINNQSITDLNDKQLSKFRNQNIGFVFQFHHLLPEFSALENVMIPGLIGDFNKEAIKERATELLSFLKLEHRLNHKPSELSGGEQQRVAIARALINQPALVLADEPSGNLDSKNAHDLHNLFKELRAKYNQTFVVVTHNLELAKLSDRIIELKDGKVVE